MRYVNNLANVTGEIIQEPILDHVLCEERYFRMYIAVAPREGRVSRNLKSKFSYHTREVAPREGRMKKDVNIYFSVDKGCLSDVDMIF